MNPKPQTGSLPSGAMREDAESFLGPYYLPEKLVVLAKGATAKKDDELNVVDPPCKSCFDFNIASQNVIRLLARLHLSMLLVLLLLPSSIVLMLPRA